MALYVTREGPTATASVWANLITVGGETRGAIIVPPGYASIKQVFVSITNCVSTDAKGMLFGVQLAGSGMKGAEYSFLAGGYTSGTITTSGANGLSRKSMVLDTNIAVLPGAEIWIRAAQITDSDGGTPNTAVTLVFSKSGGAVRSSYIRYMAAGTLNTPVAAVYDAVNATVNGIQLPQQARHITNLITAVGGTTLGATAGGGNAIVRLKSALIEGEMCLPAGGWGSELTTTGTCTGIWIPNPIPTDITVLGGATLNVEVEQDGVDWGTPLIGVSVEVE